MKPNDQFTKYLTRCLRGYDGDLIAHRNSSGVACVMRKLKKFRPVIVGEGFRFLNLADSWDFVFALTDNWTLNGVPRDWGAENVLSRLKALDIFNDPKLIEKMDEENAKVDKTKAKDHANMTEAFVLDNKRAFQKAFSDINTSTMSMRDKRKEKLFKQGKI
jgi:hypothetical protein